MEKDSAEMDLEDWEILPADGYWRTRSNPKRVIDVDYSQPSLLSPQRPKTTEEGDGNQLDQMLKTSLVPQTVISPKLEEKQEVISHAVLNQEKQNQFADMIMDSPKSNNQAFELQSEIGKWQFKEKEDGHEQTEDRIPKAETEEENRNEYLDSEIKEKGCWEGCSLNIWKWGAPGIGALCSIGMAAATICILILGGNRTSKQHPNQILQFQICNDDKGTNQAVHHATRLNQTISVTKGFPFTRARFTSGGSYISP
ncbi:hypothetical protein ACLOJK_028722 [Asimina triloba]